MIEALEPRRLLATFIVTNTLDSGAGSLRNAIAGANSSTDPNSIVFNIPGGGVHTIKPLSQLPAILVSIDIQGTTDSDGNPLIEINGQSAGAGAIGLRMTRNTLGDLRPSIVSGLIINRFSDDGLYLSGNAPAQVFGCRIGTDASGKHRLPNKNGIEIISAHNQIGLPVPGRAYQNVISGNVEVGININSTSAVGNVIQNCVIGTDLNGGYSLESLVGISTSGARTVIGGSRANQRNLISGNEIVGIQLNGATLCIVSGNYIGTNAAGTRAITGGSIAGIYLLAGANGSLIGGGANNPATRNIIDGAATGVYIGNTNDVVVSNNYIGTDVTGTKALGNSGSGIQTTFANRTTIRSNLISGNAIGIESGSTTAQTGTTILNCKIGTDVSGKFALPNAGDGIQMGDTGGSASFNVIAFNGGHGIQVIPLTTAVKNEIFANNIFSNGKLGISLGGADVPLPNHNGTVAGPNNNQNYPVLASAILTGETTKVTGSLASTANTTFSIDFYSSNSPDPSGFGEGQTFLKRISVTTNGSGNVNFNADLPAVGYGDHVTATAVSPLGDTSEFSLNVPIKGASIVGNVINDANVNGKADDNENGLAGRLVFADLDLDGRFSDGDVSDTTDSSGNYRLFGVPAGAARVRLSGNAGWRQTFPTAAAAFRDVTVAALGLAKGINFGQAKATITAATLAIDAGSNSIYDDLSGQKFSKDSGFTGGAATNTAFGVIGTDEDPLFYSYRSGSSFKYTFNVPNGSYTLRLLFVDPTSTDTGQRTFNVNANGKQVVKNLDLVAVAGIRKALVKTIQISVTNGKLTLDFTGVVGQAILSALVLVAD